MTMHFFSSRADYAGGLAGIGRVASAGFESGLSVPRVLGGRGEGTNPEELLAGAAASCYALTFGIIAEKRGLLVERFALESVCGVESEGGLRVAKITHRPRIELAASATAEERALALEIAGIAERACLVAAPLRAGGVLIEVEPTVVVR